MRITQMYFFLFLGFLEYHNGGILNKAMIQSCWRQKGKSSLLWFMYKPKKVL